MEENILRILMRQNPQWIKEEVKVMEIKRDMFHKINKFMGYPQILAVTGLRRVGKTTIMMQLLNTLINSHVEPGNIMYASFDHNLMQSAKALEDVIEYFLTVRAKDGMKYLFLDEIQKVDGWEGILKIYYDLGGIKFIISGSASLQIKKAKESLSGRILDFYLPPLSFREYLNFRKVDLPPKIEMPPDFEELKKIYEENLLNKESITEFFKDYLFKGAFPELVDVEDEEFISGYINNSVIEKIIYQDIPKVFKVKREDLLNNLIEYSAKETGKIFDITSLSNNLKADRNTISKYLFYLKNAFLIEIAYNYSRSLSKQMRKNKKVYMIHPSLSIAVAGYEKSILLSDEIAGYYVESLCNTFLSSKDKKIFFFRDPQKREVDFIVVKGNEITPVEVKYRKFIDKKDTENLKFFMEKFDCKKGVVITRDVFRIENYKNRSITYIPIWLFLMVV